MNASEQSSFRSAFRRYDQSAEYLLHTFGKNKLILNDLRFCLKSLDRTSMATDENDLVQKRSEFADRIFQQRQIRIRR